MIDWQLLFYRCFDYFCYGIIFYVAVINTIYFFLTVLGFFALRRYHARLTPEQRDALIRSPLLPEIGVIAPAYNESVTVRESVKAMLKLNYPNLQIIVVNDGSKDDTLEILIEEFRLYRSARAWMSRLPHKPIRAIYESRSPIRLMVVDKENGGKADSINAGLDVARSPLVAVVDSDSLLESDSLLQCVKPFLEDPERTLACGGMIRVVNGCQVRNGRVTNVSTSSSMLALFQSVEYIRAFLGGRVALSFFNSLLIISGAFGVFRRDAVLASGGFAVKTVGEDMELVVRLHREWREKKAAYRICYVPEPVCWTEVPENTKILKRQRNRWQRGTVESIVLHKHTILRPRFGLLGMFAVPYFALFEMFGPAVETAGYVCTVLGLLLNIISPVVATLFFVVSVLYGIVLSTTAVLLEEFTARRYPKMRDVAVLFFVAIVENLGFKQLMTYWRIEGLIDGLKGKTGWGKMERKGFGTPPAARAPGSVPDSRVGNAS